MGHTWSHLPPKPTITCPQVPEGPIHLFPLWVTGIAELHEHIVPSGEALSQCPQVSASVKLETLTPTPSRFLERLVVLFSQVGPGKDCPFLPVTFAPPARSPEEQVVTLESWLLGSTTGTLGQ